MTPPRGRQGELALVLHTHMPYVEGFGTWPFGDEWLFEAMATSYLPLLDVLDHFRSILRPGGVAYISTPNVLTLAPKGAERSGNPWHVREYRAEEFAGLLYAHFSDVQLHGLFHARRLRWHDWMLRAGWDTVHPRVGLTGAFYSRFTPAISERDFALRAGVPAQLQRALDFVAVCRP